VVTFHLLGRRTVWLIVSVVLVAVSSAAHGQRNMDEPLDAAQSRVTPAADTLPDARVVTEFIAGRTAKDWVPPKTPWGDPDIQGNFTTKDEANTPFERPVEWAGRRIEDITPQELAQAIVKRQQDALEFAPFFGGGEPEEGVAIAVPIHWFDNLSAQNSRPWFVIDPPDGKVPPLAHEAGARPAGSRGAMGGRRDTYLDRSLGDRCIAWGAWRLPTIYGNSYQILQSPDYVVIRQEQVHEARIVPLNGRAPLSEAIRSYLGDARGHWDWNTLVVVTTNFQPAMTIRGFGGQGGGAIPVKNLRLIERFTRIAKNKVEWTMTFDDQTIWTRPWSFSLPLTEDDAQIIHEYACHEGNYGLANILSAGRNADAQAATGRRH
jgi:hypothetical protein